LHPLARRRPPKRPDGRRSFVSQSRGRNPEHTTALELTVNGPTLRFNTDATVALSGAHMKVR